VSNSHRCKTKRLSPDVIDLSEPLSLDEDPEVPHELHSQENAESLDWTFTPKLKLSKDGHMRCFVAEPRPAQHTRLHTLHLVREFGMEPVKPSSAESSPVQKTPSKAKTVEIRVREQDLRKCGESFDLSQCLLPSVSANEAEQLPSKRRQKSDVSHLLPPCKSVNDASKMSQRRDRHDKKAANRIGLSARSIGSLSKAQSDSSEENALFRLSMKGALSYEAKLLPPMLASSGKQLSESFLSRSQPTRQLRHHTSKASTQFDASVACPAKRFTLKTSASLPALF